MKALLSIFVICCYINAFAQADSGSFTFKDKAGKFAAINLSILPPFLDTAFLKSNSFFQDTSHRKEFLIFSFSHSNRTYTQASYDRRIKKWKKKQRIYLEYYILTPSPSLLGSGAMDEVLLLKKMSKSKWAIKKIYYTMIEI